MSIGGRIRPEREMEIAELAEEVADWHCPGSRVDPAKIIEANDITLSFGRYAAAFDGLLEYSRGGFTSTLTSTELRTRILLVLDSLSGTSWDTTTLTNTATH